MKFIGVGDNVVDKYHHIKTMFPGGNALNFAVYARQLGYETAYVGVFGNDKVGDHIKDTLNKLGIDISRCRTKDGENGYAEVNLVEGDRVFFGGNKGGVSRTNPIQITEEDIKYFSQFDILHSSCYSYLNAELVKLKVLDKTIITYDFSDKNDDEILKSVCPFIDVALFSAGHIKDNDDVRKLLKDANYLGASIAIASQGVDGQIIYDGETFYSGKVKLVKAVDTLGAGDSFFTQFIISLLEQGYKKGSILTEKMVETASDKAADFSAKTCSEKGAFGYGKKF